MCSQEVASKEPNRLSVKRQRATGFLRYLSKSAIVWRKVGAQTLCSLDVHLYLLSLEHQPLCRTMLEVSIGMLIVFHSAAVSILKEGPFLTHWMMSL